MDFYSSKETCNLDKLQIYGIVDFDLILGIKSKRITFNKNVLIVQKINYPN